MIDDYNKAMALMRKMEAQLPIPARPTEAYVRAARGQGVAISRDQAFQICSVLYLGDMGGIACALTPQRDIKEALVVSLTHLEVEANHPLSPEIRAYQVARTRGLALESAKQGRPTSFTIRIPPRKDKKRKR